MVYDSIANPFSEGADQSIITWLPLTEVVGVRGFEGTVAHRTVTMSLNVL